MVDVKSKVLRCLFELDEPILCTHRRSEKFGLMDKCLKCPHYEAFLRVMAEEDEKEMDEIDRMVEEFEARSESFDG